MNTLSKAAAGKKRKGILSYWRDYLALAPFFIIFFTLTVLPVIISICLGFTYYNILETPKFVGLNNYIQLIFHDKIFSKAVSNTMVLAVITGPVGYISALITAWMINELNPKLRTALVFMIYAPTISGNAYLIWQLLFSEDSHGYLNSMLKYLGIIDSPIYWLSDPKYMMTVVITVSLWLSMGTGFLSFVAGLQGINVSLLEAGSMDGISNRWEELWHLILPSMKPQLLFGAVMSITSAFSVGAISSALCGMPSTDYAVHTVMNHLNDYGTTRFQMGYASAIATMLFAVMIISNKLIQKLLRKVGE